MEILAKYSDKGTIRKRNEDVVECLEHPKDNKIKLLVLCDGKNNGILDARTCQKEEVGYLMTSLKEVN